MSKIAALFFCLTASLFADEWSVKVPFDFILNPPDTTAELDVSLSCNSLTGQVLATWGDNSVSPALPTYSFYDGTSWSYDTGMNTPLRVSTMSSIATDLITAFNPTTGDFLATWADSMNSYFPTYSIYNSGSGWSAAAAFNTNGVGGDRSVHCIYNPVSNSFFAAWQDHTVMSSGNPMYSIYSGGSWSTPAPISTDVVLNATVYLSCNPNNGDVLATWSSTGHIATYSIYSGGSWSPATTLAASPTVQVDVTSCFDVTSGQFMAAWAAFAVPDYPYYSFYDPMSGWTTPAEISGTSQADTNVLLSQDTSTGSILATWLDVESMNQSPTYSIYNGTSWSAAAFISAAATSNSEDCFSCYNSSTGQFFAGWVDNTDAPGLTHEDFT